MRKTALIIAIALIGTAASYSWANAPIKATMRDWKAGLGALDALTASGAAYDGGEISRIAKRLSDDADKLASHMSSSNPRAQDVKSRFEALAADAQSLAGVAHRDTARVKYNALQAECVSCHDAYAR